jgi:hypothetical protein
VWVVRYLRICPTEGSAIEPVKKGAQRTLQA